MTAGDRPPSTEIVLYQSEDGQTRIQCRFEDGSIWLPQRLIAELFQVTVSTVNEHLTGIYADGELHREETIRSFRRVRLEGSREVTREVEHYSLPAILAVGMRVRSQRGTPFRQWQYCTTPWSTLADVWQTREGDATHVYETDERVSDSGGPQRAGARDDACSL